MIDCWQIVLYAISHYALIIIADRETDIPSPTPSASPAQTRIGALIPPIVFVIVLLGFQFETD